MTKDTHEEDCSEVQDYSDGTFSYCLCSARIMNTVCCANITHKRDGNRPAKVIEIVWKDEK